MSRNADSFMPPRWILTVTAVVGLVWLMMKLRELVVLVVVGYFIAYAIDPILERLQRKGISRIGGFFIVFILMVAIVVLTGVTAVPTIVYEFTKLSDNLNGYIETSRDKIVPLLQALQGNLPEPIRNNLDLNDLKGSLATMMSHVSGDTVKKIGRTAINTLLRGYSLSLALLNIALLPFIVFYLAVDLPQIHGFFRNVVPLTKRSKVDRMFGEIDSYVSSFVRGQAIVCSILFGLYAIGLGFVGVDLWLLLAAITGFGNMIPYVGTMIGISLSCVMALVTFGDLTHVFWVLGVFATVQALEGMVITPRVMGESVGLSPLVIILALFAGGQLFGLLGIFLAIPAAATLRVLIRHSYRWALNT